MNTYKIFTINPGSTSTKIGVFENSKPVFVKSIKHSFDEIKKFDSIVDQHEFRKNLIMNELSNANIDIRSFDIIVARGGVIKPISSGIYEVNETMLTDVHNCTYGEHASNLGAIIADDIIRSSHLNIKAYIVDPVVVDELQDVARITGLPEIHRISIFHALNHKIIARTYAKNIGKKYEDLNLIVAHLGGGISVGAHCHGRIIDVNNALNGEAPFSPERSGTLPQLQLAQLCFSGKYTFAQIKRMITGNGGLAAIMGTNEASTVEKMAAEGNKKAQLIQEAMCYNIGKHIGAKAAVLKGKVDAIILTGGVAHNKFLVNYLREMVGFIAPIVVYAGEDELAALAMNGLMLLRGEVELKIYA